MWPFVFLLCRNGVSSNVSSSGAVLSDQIFHANSSSQKQSRQQLDKRYQSIRKTMSSNVEGSCSSNGILSSSLFGGLEGDGSLAAVVAASSITPERQRELLTQV